MSLRPLIHNRYDGDYDWMNDVQLEVPSPIMRRRRRRRVKIIFAAMAILSIITGVMYAISN